MCEIKPTQGKTQSSNQICIDQGKAIWKPRYCCTQ